MRLFRDIRSLRKYLIDQRKVRSLRAIQREDFPQAKSGTLSRIINDVSYIPVNRAIRQQLFLPDTCQFCHRKFIVRRERPPIPHVGMSGWEKIYLKRIAKK